MSKYYLCNDDIAEKHCINLQRLAVHWCGKTSIGIYDGWIITTPTLIESGWQNGVLLKDLNNDMQVLLTLVDTEFKEVHSYKFGRTLLLRVHNEDEWELL